MRTWDSWQDPGLARSIAVDEPQRFSGLVAAIEADVLLASRDGSPDAWHTNVLRWIPIANKCVLGYPMCSTAGGQALQISPSSH